ncbi:Peptidyl-prolyl cis-trans isomerase-like 2 [Metarhizium anisopliae]
MIQGGDPSGTGKGGSVYGASTLMTSSTGHSRITAEAYATPHLDRKHDIWTRGRRQGCPLQDEAVQTDGSNRPLNKIFIRDVVVFVDPFEEFQTQRKEQERQEHEQEEIRRKGGTDDDRTTWTGKRIRGDGTIVSAEGKESVGKYLNKDAVSGNGSDESEAIGSRLEDWQEPVRKKMKGSGGFGNFDSW